MIHIKNGELGPKRDFQQMKQTTLKSQLINIQMIFHIIKIK